MTDALPDQPAPRRPPPELLTPGVLVPTLLLLTAVGFWLFVRGVGVPTGSELSKPASVFVAVNAATLTGFQQARNPADYTPAGQVITLGLMIGGTLFSLVGGGLAVVRIARLPFRDWTLAFVAGAGVVAAMILGAVFDRGPPRTAFDGAYQAASAFGNCGLFTGRLPPAGGPQTLGLLLPLAFVGSLGLPVLMDLVTCLPRRRSMSDHTRRVLLASAVAYLLTAAALLPLLAVSGPPGRGPAWPWAAVTASREAVNARSAGFPFQFVGGLSDATALVLLVAMVAGGASGGTAGGLKVNTLAVACGGVWTAVRGRPTASRTFGVAVGWVGVYLGVLLVAAVALLLAEPDVRADRVLFLAVSALGNVGLSHDPVPGSAAGLYVLSATMLVGRVLPVVGLWVVADRLPDVVEPVG